VARFSHKPEAGFDLAFRVRPLSTAIKRTYRTKRVHPGLFMQSNCGKNAHEMGNFRKLWYLVGCLQKKLVKIMTDRLNADLKYPKKRWNHNLWLIHRKIEAGPLGTGRNLI
jgi:hypothetical protein